MEPKRLNAATLFRRHAPAIARFLRRRGVRRQDCEDLVQEVSAGRIYDGVHFRNSTEVGSRMGEQIGALLVAAYHLP